ncbi:unnamed protein product [Owenia fusiformis]|uniref:NADH dehydrogenase [ubiquinone] 1 beta subcomplex subunit 9 n=1 Tax=Owenia fusiformis TaxID=6347 RepID=A0A8J1UT03_OWEFU|nr:unnamed protein product [Owenia fusiformis]
MSYLTTRAASHAQKVCSLYKKALRECQNWHYFPHLYRYHQVVMRARFDENKDVVDMVKAKQLLEEGEAELWERKHPQPFKFTDSPGGVAYGREAPPPDWLLDTWTPLEKARYPEYFARREIRKEEYIKRWQEKYGNQKAGAH